MAKISMNIDTEQAVDIILGVASILNDKYTLDDPSATCYGDGGFLVLQDALLVAAKVIDIEHCKGSKTEGVFHIEGSAE